MSSHRISEALYKQIAIEAQFQCGYCRAPQIALPYRLEIEHLQPTSRGGLDSREYLWLSCHKCNKTRSNQSTATDPLTGESARLFNPRIDQWNTHFAWAIEGTHIVGLSDIGRATIECLRLNDSYYVSARTVWIMAKIHPPRT